MKWSEVLVAQSCPTLGDPMDCSLSGSSVHGILQERILEWVAISFSRGSSRPRDGTWASCIAGRFFSVCFTIITPLNLEAKLHLCPSHKFSTSTEGNSAEDWEECAFSIQMFPFRWAQTHLLSALLNPLAVSAWVTREKVAGLFLFWSLTSSRLSHETSGWSRTQWAEC